MWSRRICPGTRIAKTAASVRSSTGNGRTVDDGVGVAIAVAVSPFVSGGGCFLGLMVDAMAAEKRRARRIVVSGLDRWDLGRGLAKEYPGVPGSALVEQFLRRAGDALSELDDAELDAVLAEFRERESGRDSD
jgi:hypothetical protein